jgi:GAF domain-containing protein
VSDRTRDIEKHALQLQVAAQVANEAAAIRDMEQLLNHTVHLISERFDFYHAGIFLIDDTGKYAVLRAASSDGGQRMFERGHKLEVGEEGIVGYVAGKGEPRLVLDVGEDDRYFDNPDMPRTRSEMALPLVVRQEVIGVLDVQSTRPSAFMQDDINVLQILADQVALALDNARLLAESMLAFNKLEKVYKQDIKHAWNERLANQKIAYSYNQSGVQKDAPSPLSSISENEDPYILKLPLSFRGLSLGSISLRRSNDQPPWSIDDVQLVKTTISQIVLALENARLMDEIRRHAQQEEALNKISASAHSSLDLETVMKKAVKDIGQALGAQKVQIRLSNTDPSFEKNSEPDQAQVLES